MRVLPYFQSIIPKSSVATSRPGPLAGSVEPRKLTRTNGGTRPLQDKFIPTSLATGIVHSIRQEEVAVEIGTGGRHLELEQIPGIVKSGMYSLYRLDGSLSKESASTRGDKLDIKG